MEKMLQSMMKKFPWFIGMGFMIVIVALIIGAINAGNSANYYAFDKVTRETRADLALLLASVESTIVWLPYFKFLGVAMILGGITMALGVIIQILRDLGNSVMARWPADLNPGTPEKPMAAKLFPMIMMMGWILLIAGLIWALSLNGVVVSYWDHSIAGELNPAQPGSTLLQQLAVIQGTLPWLNTLRFLGMAFLFTGITVALTVIIRTLQFQEKALEKFVQARSAKAP